MCSIPFKGRNLRHLFTIRHLTVQTSQRQPVIEPIKGRFGRLTMYEDHTIICLVGHEYIRCVASLRAKHWSPHVSFCSFLNPVLEAGFLLVW